MRTIYRVLIQPRNWYLWVGLGWSQAEQNFRGDILNFQQFKFNFDVQN